MRWLLAILLLGSVLPLNAQVKWNTSTRVGINRIGFGLDQSLGLIFGKNKAQTIALGVKWYAVDVVFQNETIGLAIDYRYTFKNGGNPMSFALGISNSFFSEKIDLTNRSRIFESTLTSRGSFVKWERFNPFIEFGIGVVMINSDVESGAVTSTYPNYSLALGITFNLKKTD